MKEYYENAFNKIVYKRIKKLIKHFHIREIENREKVISIEEIEKVPLFSEEEDIGAFLSFLDNSNNILDKLNTECLYNSISKLSDKERKILNLYYFENLSIKQISNILDTTENSIKVQKSIILNKLRKILGKGE